MTAEPIPVRCPRCGAADCYRDSVDVGIGVMYGPYGCPCGWSEDPRYDITEGPKTESGYRVDQWGGLTPAHPGPGDAVTDLRDQPACPTDALGRSECARTLVDISAGGDVGKPGCEITVSTSRPLVRGPYTTDGFVCPHGVEYWIEPTGEQIADWAARGVR